MILRDEIIIFKGGGVVSVSSCLVILNTLPHCKNVVLDIYNTVETITCLCYNTENTSLFYTSELRLGKG